MMLTGDIYLSDCFIDQSNERIMLKIGKTREDVILQNHGYQNRKEQKTKVMSRLNEDFIRLVWGNEIKESIFERWSQAFEYSPDENSALIQFEGGPCSVLTPVQAHLLNDLLFSPRYEQRSWRKATREEIDLHFLNALTSILQLLSKENPNEIYLAYLQIKPNEKLKENEFHQRISFELCRTTIELKEKIFSRLSMWKNTFGVLLFLYSCLMTKTMEKIRKEIDDETSLPLIDCEYGHGSQSLTNLLITGYATPHCFDGEKDLGGVKLHGIPHQAKIGFLSQLEMYRLLEVGWFLKNPQCPIWILGSETHLTVFFSPETALVQLDQITPSKQASIIFHKYDTEKNGFISIELLDDVINEILSMKLIDKLPSINELKRRLDPDNLQIITESSFLTELFPRQTSNEGLNGPLNGKPFLIYHYNGLPRSNKDNQVRYISGQAFISDYSFSNENSSKDQSNLIGGSYLPITSVLRTKWSSIELKWNDDFKPSLN